MVDLSAQGQGRDPVSDWKVINRELARYSSDLAARKQLIAANKIDLPLARERLPAFVKAMKRRAFKIFPISAATGEGVADLLDATAQLLSEASTSKGADIGARDKMRRRA